MRSRLLTILLLSLGALDAHAMVLRKAGSANPPPTGNPSLAATWTAKYNPLCAKSLLGDYYAEIDSGSAVLWSYQVGTTVTRTGGLNNKGTMKLASASKFIAEFVAATRDGPYTSFPASEIAQLQQMDGSNNQSDTCPAGSALISTCLQVVNASPCSPATGLTLNGVVIASNEYGATCTGAVGLFSYGSGHFNINALQYGPSAMYNASPSALATYVDGVLGITGLTYDAGQLAGEANMSPANFATLLQNVINGTLPNAYNALSQQHTVVTNYSGNRNAQGTGEPAGGVAGQYYGYTNSVTGEVYAGQTVWNPELGTPGNVTVTNTTTIGAAGPNGAWLLNGISQTGNPSNPGGSPIPENWQYGLGWSETDPASHGDGAYSSAGSFGFYPWISHDKTLVGMLARATSTGGVGFQSAQCGRVIRRAWTSGNGQPSSVPSL